MRWVSDTETGSDSNVIEHPNLARFRTGRNTLDAGSWGQEHPAAARCEDLLSIVEDLELFIGDLHVMYQSATARQILFRLHACILDHLVEAAAILRSLDDPQSGNRTDPCGELANRTVGECRALEDLLKPVRRGLRAITQNCLPGDMTDFVFSAITLAEFCRMHVRFKQMELYPALDRV